MVPVELFGEPWVLFRDEHGAAACVRDECAHRACPLSLGRVIDGRVQVSRVIRHPLQPHTNCIASPQPFMS